MSRGGILPLMAKRKTPLELLEDETEKRHEENEKRFDKVENKVSEIGATVRIILYLLVANGLLNVLHFFVKPG
jgi:DNA-binding protein H-NS